MPLNRLDKETLKCINNNDPDCWVLNISFRSLGLADLKELAIALIGNQSLKVLTLGDDEIDDTGAQVLAAALTNNRTLEILNLTNNKISEVGIQALANGFFKNNFTLTELCLGENKIGIAGVQAIVDNLKNSCTLTLLDLKKNQITAAGAQTLADNFLQNNSTLSTLDLDDNPIGDAGATALANVLKDNKSLIILRLSNCQISDVGAKDLVSMLKQNHSLLHLVVDNNSINQSQKQEIQHLTNRNLTLAKQFIDAASRGNINTLKGLLQQGVSVNCQDRMANTALHVAVQANNEKLVKFLIEYGANQHLKNIFDQTPWQMAEGTPFALLEKQIKVPQVSPSSTGFFTNNSHNTGSENQHAELRFMC